MDEMRFVDALTGDTVISHYATGELFVEKSEPGKLPFATAIFFPGCSMINYAMPLVESVYATLKQHECVDGISLLCCGKILSYEPGGDILRESFEEQLREHISQTDIKRIVCACPNCVKALREAFASDERTKDIELQILPQVLADIGYRVDASTTARLIKGDADADVLLCTHDSCPDREYGDFARGLRSIIPEDLWVDPEHCYRRSVCCGSLPRAAGKVAAADKCANICGQEALDVKTDAIVTACMSCAFQLNMAQSHVQAVHFLELLYDWRINWAGVGMWMKVRFLFDETLGATERTGESASGRNYAALGTSEDAAVSDVAATEIAASEHQEADMQAAHGVAISNDGVEKVGL